MMNLFVMVCTDVNTILISKLIVPSDPFTITSLKMFVLKIHNPSMLTSLVVTLDREASTPRLLTLLHPYTLDRQLHKDRCGD